MLRKASTSPDVPAEPYRFAIVCADYNPELTGPLLDATQAELLALKARSENIKVFHVPGCFEIPVVASELARCGRHDVVIALAVVLQGKTRHAHHILQATAFHLQQIAVETGVPVVNQVLSPASLEEARERTAPGPLNRGVEAARTAAAMAHRMKQLGGGS